ncbi:hypothetical protein WN66_04495 [Saccharomyces cerevisiae]|uniref:Putative uncharacterized membrane protein YLR311C n=1 Tax=Saccharomyces cerevisiae (strain ATCC 204508 / S288c) TaxID=559292 RepID=YL311_YEAST|nr:RecName: Full=Putative uncharacterized membrane protein YLR311C [Saccharomyces cerevisiae S288C]AAB64518.1 Ylr311cp [Saccharomyces cerevisiae]KZV09554.1 hypothetical protein WN66_04495 [Saccharomyces cerevisiae]WNV73018.1 hypothetical protein O6U65_1880 [Saccharomyces cerevisiae synthetic construct]
MKLTKEKKNDCLVGVSYIPPLNFFTLTFLFLLRIEKVHLSLSLSLSLSLRFYYFHNVCYPSLFLFFCFVIPFFYSVRFILLYLHILRSFYELNILLLYGAENSRRQSPPGYYVIR